MSGHNKKKVFDPRISLPAISQERGDLILQGLDRYSKGIGATEDLSNYTHRPGEQQSTTETAASSDLLTILKNGGSIYDAISAWILSMSNNTNFTPEITDQLRALLYQITLTDNQRQYDQTMLQDSRLYNNPQNEMTRLMAAGIGRDAAIQLMSGAAGGQGIGQGSAASAPSVPAPSGTTDISNRNSIVSTVGQAVSMLGQLVDSGLSMAQGVEQIKSLNLQNQLSQQNFNAYNNANDLVQQLTASGIDFSKYSNADDLIKELNSLAQSNNEQALGIINSSAYKGTFGTIPGREFFNNFWKNVRQSRDDGTIADRYLHQLELDNTLRSVSIDKVGAEMSLIGKQESEIEQRIIESASRVASIDADIKVKNAQGDWIAVQTKNYERRVDAEINLMDSQAWAANNQGDFAIAQTEGQNINNNINRDIFEINHAGFPMMKDAHIIECERELRKLRLQNDSDGQKKQLQQWALEQDNAIKLAYFEQIYYNSAGDFIQNHPSLYALATGFHMCGANELVQTGVGTGSAIVGAAKTAAKFIK